MNALFEDCYARLEGTRLTIGNSLIERVFEIDGGGLIPLEIVSKKNGKVWARPEEARRIGLPFRAQTVRGSARVEDNGGLSERHLRAEIVWQGKEAALTRTFSVFPGLPFVSVGLSVRGSGLYEADADRSADFSGNENSYASGTACKSAQRDCIDVIPTPRGHYRLHTALLCDKSDQNDMLARESVRPVYSSGWGGEWEEGSLFVVEDYTCGDAFLLVKEAPFPMSALSRTQKDVFFERGCTVQAVGSGLDGQAMDEKGIIGYGTTVGVGNAGELHALFRRFYKAVWNRRGGALIMSNTWGDRSQDRAVCHDFMMKEIDKAAWLGADIVQIDDGWQHGHTVNSALHTGGVWEGYYQADPDFWTVNTAKFPQGLAPLVQKAASHGIELGLWFSPDSTNDFAAWRRDADTLLGLWRNEGIRHFKLDGVNIRSKIGERNYISLLDAVSRESGNRIWVNQDITAQVRLDSLYFKQYGNMFVENRYTDTAAYYPHRTLRNLWTLSRYIPPAKLQFEALNPRRNPDRYPPDDPFRPDRYDMDYIFAVTMLSSPLLWMEMSHLGEEDSRRLKAIIDVSRAHRDRFAAGDVTPIGDMPDGQSMPGFLVDCGGSGYLLLFRESTPRDTFVCPLPSGARVRILISNAEAAVRSDEGGVSVRLNQERSYAFLEWKAQKKER